MLGTAGLKHICHLQRLTLNGTTLLDVSVRFIISGHSDRFSVALRAAICTVFEIPLHIKSIPSVEPFR